MELTGGTPFPAIGELPYLLTLPGHGFYWFDITPASDKQGQRPAYPDDAFGQRLQRRCRCLNQPRNRHRSRMAADQELAELLGRWLPGQRWFAGKGDAVEVTIESRTNIADLPERSSEQVLFTVPSATGVQRYQMLGRLDPARCRSGSAGVLIGEAGDRRLRRAATTAA